ncbi:MAG: hypothetical protein PHS30_04410 [Bacteroidales bacterium]|nr:hypothetical protein [Bacteroidales bacterium]
MKRLAVVAVILLSASIFTGCGLYSYTAGLQTTTSYANPQWAPPYYSGARYYYLPDIESYYDLSVNEFIYLRNGVWVYSQSMPSMYADFDLNNCFSIVLNVDVYRPWMHHQYYVSHYPRYYYRDYYDHSNIPYVRGFNENRKSAIYWGENERHRARSWDDRNLRDNRNFKYQKEDRQQQKNTDFLRGNSSDRPSGTRNSSDESIRTKRPDVNNDRSNQNDRGNQTTVRGTQSDRSNQGAGTTRTTPTTNTPRQQSGNTPEAGKTQNTNYYGRTIGNPVKVEKQMQHKEETNQSGKAATRPSEPAKASKSTGRR